MRLPTTLADDADYPRFGPRAANLGIRSALGLRLIADDRLGTMNLYRALPHAFGIIDRARAVILDAHGSTALDAAQTRAQVAQTSREDLHVELRDIAQRLVATGEDPRTIPTGTDHRGRGTHRHGGRHPVRRFRAFALEARPGDPIASPLLAARGHGGCVGREPERKRVGGLLDAARRGASGVLLLTGEPGIGKSALVADAAETARAGGFLVLAATGREAEADIGFATLHALLRPVFGELDRLGPVQAAWLRGALGLDVPPDPPPGELGVYHATLRLLTLLAQDRPVALLVDDVHWVDRASLLALSFVVHRLDADPVVAVFARRPEPSPLDRAGFEELVLDGLGDDEAVALLAPAGVAPAVARRCGRLVGGNPLAMLEGVRSLSAGQRSGADAMPATLPVGRALADELGRRLDGLPGPAARAVALAALDGTGDVAVVADALERLGGSIADLAPAEAAGVVVVEGAELEWAHPLLRAAARDRTSGPERRRLRAALLAASAGHVSPEVLVEHLAANAEGPDEALAGHLEDSGQRLVRRAALDAAARAFEHAARLSPDTGESARRILLAAGTRVSAGRSRDSLALVEPLLADCDDPVLAARLASVVGSVETWMVNPTAGVHRLSAALAAVRRDHPALAAQLALHVAMGRMVTLDGPAAVAAARDGVLLARRSGDPTLVFGSGTVLAVLSELAGTPVGEGPSVGQLAELLVAAHASGAPATEMLTLVCASAEVVRDELDAARAHAESIVQVSERAGTAAWAIRGRMVRAEVAWRQGRWSDALAELHQTLSLDEALGGDGIAPAAWSAVARIEAAVGAASAAREHAQRAVDDVGDSHRGWDVAPAWAAVGLAALGAGELDEAVACHERVARATAAINQPGLLWWHADAVEALHGLSRPAEARMLLDRLEADAARNAGRWAPAAAARCRALLAPLDGEAADGAERDLAAALEGFTAIGAPFEQGRTLLVRGERRLARGDRVDGVRDLAAARSLFDRLGARPWSDRASRARGEAPAATGSLATLLSAAELRVALAVATGATNRQAAEELYLSAKTVDYHLRAIFRKLGLRSRAELAALVATERALGPVDGEPGAPPR